MFLLGSRYCETDKMSQIAWDMFSKVPFGWGRVNFSNYPFRKLILPDTYQPTTPGWPFAGIRMVSRSSVG